MRPISNRKIGALALALLLCLPIIVQHPHVQLFKFIRFGLFAWSEDGLPPLLVCLFLSALTGFLLAMPTRLYWWACVLTGFGSLIFPAMVLSKWPIWLIHHGDLLMWRSVYFWLMLAFVPVLLYFFNGKELRNTMITACAACAAVQGVASVFQWSILNISGLESRTARSLLLVPYLLQPVDSQGTMLNAYRMSGLLSSISTCSLILLIGIPYLLEQIVESSSRFKRSALIICFGLCLCAVLLTYSRAAYLVLIIWIILWIWRQCRQSQRPFQRSSLRRNFTTFALPIFLILTILILAPQIVGRFSRVIDVQDRSWTHRAHIYLTALQLVFERPLSGWGIGGFNTLYNRFYRLPLETYSFYDVHSSVFHFFTLYGLCGTAIWVNVAVNGIWSRLAWIRLAWSTRAAIIGTGVMLLTDNPGASAAAAFPLLYLLMNVVVELRYASDTFNGDSDLFREARPRIMTFLCTAYLIGLIWPTKDYNLRFKDRLQDAFRGTDGETSFVIQDLQIGQKRNWTSKATYQTWAGTAGDLGAFAAVANSVVLEIDSSLSVHSKNLQSVSNNQIRLAVSQFYPDAVAACMQTSAAIVFCSQTTYAGTNIALSFPQEQAYNLSRALPSSVTPDILRERFELTTDDMSPSWFMSAHQLHQMFKVTRESTCPSSTLLNEALRNSKFKYGLLAFTPASAKTWAFASHGPVTHAETVEIETSQANYRITVLRSEKIPRIGIRQPVFHAFARFGHRVGLFLSTPKVRE